MATSDAGREQRGARRPSMMRRRGRNSYHNKHYRGCAVASDAKTPKLIPTASTFTA